MSTILVTPRAREVYLDLDRRCRAEYGSPITANYIEGEIRRVVLKLSLNSDNHGLVTYRIPKGFPLESYWFVVVVPSPTGYSHDAAVIWSRRRSDDRPVLQDIDLHYIR